MNGILTSGSIAIITGASSGIGATTARHLAERGVRVIGTGRNRNKLEELAADLGESGLMIEMDVRDEAGVAGVEGLDRHAQARPSRSTASVLESAFWP